MSIDILLKNRAKKDSKKLPIRIKERFFIILEKLKKDPLIGLPLSGDLNTYRKIRLGEHRVVYKFYPKDKLIVIARIEPRGKVYKN